mgnify:CR=1 FL=1
MHRLNIYISQSQIDKLKDISKQDDIKVSELIRRALDNFLSNKQIERNNNEKNNND